MYPNLADAASPAQMARNVENFAQSIIGFALADHLSTRRRRTGAELLGACAGSCRGFHAMMASGLYNKTRDTLETMGKP